MPSATISKLAAITDAALFERLATSVLRAAKPDIYESISHQGVNTNGKTIKAPLDNFGYAKGGSIIVAAAHTTAAKGGLEKKWLHDPSTVKPRKNGAQSTQPAGDLIKAIREIENVRIEHPDLSATLALTCNAEESQQLRVKVESLAKKHNIVLDVWSVSRLAQFLDTDPIGQAIRRDYLGIDPTRLSMPELLRIGGKSLSALAQSTAIEENLLIHRELPGHSAHTLLSGASGMGKTTICFGILSGALHRKQSCIVLQDTTVMHAVSMEEALDIELRRYSPSLEQFSGRTALALCSAVPILIMVEDINRAENTERLLNKIVNWALQSQKDPHNANWRLICPVWPQFLGAIDKKEDVFKAGMVQSIGLYNSEEAQAAVRQRFKAAGRVIEDLQAASLAQALGNDPLLIGLHDLDKNKPPADVINQYIEDEVERVARASSMIASDVIDSLNALARNILERRNLKPTWTEIQKWVEPAIQTAALRALISSGRVIRLKKGDKEQLLEARHDRVLYHLLSEAAGRQLETDASAAYLSDPYYAEIVGVACSDKNLSLEGLTGLMQQSPLVPFYALKYSVECNESYIATALSAAEQHIRDENAKNPRVHSVRHSELGILAQIDSPVVLDLTSCYSSSNRYGRFSEARFRNGDIKAGFEWLMMHPFDVSIPGRKELIEHVRRKFNIQLMQAITATLADQTSSRLLRRGALLLTGYIADPSLAKSVSEAWLLEKDNKDLDAFLWAAARVCGDNAKTILGPICDAWASLPDEKGPQDERQRSSLAAYAVASNFTKHIPELALPYFVQRANRSDELNWPITYMLKGVDHPIAVQHGVEYLAALSRKAGKNGFYDHFLKDRWSRSQDNGVPMSQRSRQHLLDLSRDHGSDAHLRKQAFALWEVCIHPDDLEIARSIDRADVRYDKSVWARARRNDLSVIPELLEKIEEDPRYWWQAGRYIWTEELTKALRKAVGEVSETNVVTHTNDEGWMLPELILRLDEKTGEDILLSNWNGVRHSPRYVQAALLIGTPKLIKLVEIVVKDASDPKSLFKYFGSHVGLRSRGQKGVERIEQIQTMRPFFGFFSDLDLNDLRTICIERGWLEYARAHIDPILRNIKSDYAGRVLGSATVDFSDLEAELNDKRRFSAYYWIEQEVRRGMRREELFPALNTWLQEKNSSRSVSISGEVISREGTRSDFATWKDIAATIPNSAEIVYEVRFNVFSRTLN